MVINGLLKTKCFFGYKISDTRSAANDYFSSKAFSFLYRDFVKVCSRRAFGAYMYLVMIKIVFSKVHHKNICCGC